MTKSKSKKKKIDSLPKIHRRLFKLWSEKVRARANFLCEYCGKGKGEIQESGKPITKLDAHHLITRQIKDNPLKFDIRNGVAADPTHHKFGSLSFHKNPVITIAWLIKTRPDDFKYITEHFSDKVDIDNRLILQEIERCLNNDEFINIEKLKEIEEKYPRKTAELKYEGSLFEEDKSSSSE
jgi:hypothetical protein